jgi:hypothetical protein
MRQITKKTIEEKKKYDIDYWRKFHLAFAELVDAWRIIPRIVILGYGFLLFYLTYWYITLEPRIIEGCNIEALGETCIYNPPTTQHAALLTTVTGIAAAIFAFYASTGRKWDNKEFIPWASNAKKEKVVEETIEVPDEEFEEKFDRYLKQYYEKIHNQKIQAQYSGQPGMGGGYQSSYNHGMGSYYNKPYGQEDIWNSGYPGENSYEYSTMSDNSFNNNVSVNEVAPQMNPSEKPPEGFMEEPES